MPKPMKNDELTASNSAASNKDRKKAQKRLEKVSPAKPEAKKAVGKVVYPEVKGSLKVGDEALTYEEAMQLLGWEVQTKEDGETLLHDLEGKPVRCTNNANNRPYINSWGDTLAQEILRKRWAGENGDGDTPNGENIIIGRFGSVLSGQHRLVALVKAVELWKSDKDKYPEWGTEPVIDTFMAFGISEDDKVVNTIDTGKPRSISDVIYRSDYFKDVDNADRKGLSRACESAVKLFWDRTGVSDAYDIARTHSEILDLLNRHKTLLDCVKHLYEENVANRVGRLVGVGSAATYCYLMGSSKTKPSAYYERDVRTEENLDFSEMDSAREFWIELIKTKNSRLKAVWDVLAEMLDSNGDAGVSFNEKSALVIKAWQCGGNVKASALKLQYHTDEDKIKHLAEFPTIGGIDVGEAADKIILADEDEEDKEDEQDDPTPEVKKGGKAKDVKLPRDGDEVWVKDNPKEDAWFGTLITTRNAPGGTTVAKVRYQSNQKVYDVKYDCLTLENPNDE